MVDFGLRITLPPQKLYPHGFEGAPHRLLVGGFGDGFGEGFGDGLGDGFGEGLGVAFGDGVETRTWGLGDGAELAEEVPGAEVWS